MSSAIKFRKDINPYLLGLLLFAFAFIIGLLTYKDYGISWDEVFQRETGITNYDYIFHHNLKLLTYRDKFYGAGFEVPLIIFERLFKLKDIRDIYLMRHFVTHLLFLISALSAYVLMYRLFKDKVVATIGFVILVFAPRIYAHSFYNTKDIPFLSMFLITLAFCQYTFEKNKMWLYVILGILCGYTTSLRVMGIMLCGFISVLSLLDVYFNIKDKKSPVKTLARLGLFLAGFCATLVTFYPYLWRNPVPNFLAAYKAMAHYNWGGSVLLDAKFVPATDLPWTYFPTWFLITTPIVWLLVGFAGIGLVLYSFFKKPLNFLRNTNERNFLLFGACFAVPIFAVIFLHSVIYDDWRHLYFVYPSFVLLGLYFVNKLYHSKARMILVGVCGVQAALLGFFMIKNHPFQMVFFNSAVSHDEEYLRKNYELEYWGCSFKQGLDYLVENDTSRTIKVCTGYLDPLKNNLIMLKPADRSRIQVVNDVNKADYFVTNFRGHPDDYPSTNIEYSVSVLNSTILCIYRIKDNRVKVQPAGQVKLQ